MENNYTQYSDELKKTDPTSPFYDEIRKTELQIDILQETKSSVTNKNELINQLKTKLEELKRQQNLRETSDNFGELKKTELEDLNKQKKRELSLKFPIKNETERLKKIAEIDKEYDKLKLYGYMVAVEVGATA